MLDQYFYISKTAGIAELIVIAIGIIALVVPAVWNRARGPRPASSEQIATDAERYRQRYGDAAFSRIGTEMHQERVANGISSRYRHLREISGCLCSWNGSAGGTARPSYRLHSGSWAFTERLPPLPNDAQVSKSPGYFRATHAEVLPPNRK